MIAFTYVVISSHDRRSVEVTCYFTNPLISPDNHSVPILDDEESTVQQRLEASVEWCKYLTGMSAAEVAQTINADGIQILVCAGDESDRHNILDVLALKPAPIQVSNYICATYTKLVIY
jgi:predicted O-linked N-acetylglucosamine transferase (SPINDLY family)